MYSVMQKIDDVFKQLQEDDVVSSYKIESIDTHILEVFLPEENILLRYTYLGLSNLEPDEIYSIIKMDVSLSVEEQMLVSIKKILNN